MSDDMYDVLILGAGIVGTTLARYLARYDISVALIDKHADVACGTSKANSAIIHAGYDAECGTLMASLNVRGNYMYSGLCEELAVPFARPGSFVCAFDHDELTALEKLLANGIKAGVPHIRIIDRDEALSKEPRLNPALVAALEAPSAGILMPWEVCIACAENAVDNGVKLMLNTRVTGIRKIRGGFAAASVTGELYARNIVNCAGVQSAAVAAMIQPEQGFFIQPRRGQYYVLDKTQAGLVSRVLFPAPSKLGKGIVVAPTYDGNILLGPDAEDLPNERMDNTATTAAGLALVADGAKRLVPDVQLKSVITTFAGIRAQSSTGDFIIGESGVRGFYNAAGIKSPGLSAAPAIAEMLGGMLIETLAAKEKNSYNPRRRPRINMEKLSLEERARLIRGDPRYAHIVCRCESVSEGEIIDAIHRSAGAVTLNGVKRRVRPGAGRCQGGFCGPRVLAILARELGCNPCDVRQEDAASYILTGSLNERT